MNIKIYKTVFVFIICSAVTLYAERFEFNFQINDYADNITNLSYLNHKPAGKFGYIKSGAGGHLYLDSKRIRLYGVNMVAGNCFPEKNDADKIAKQLARLGINLVRLHHMDGPWAGLLIHEKNGGYFNQNNLDKLDYFVAQLIKNGIYVNVNLLCSRKFYSYEGLPGDIDKLDWKEQHTVGFFYEKHMELQKEYARNLLDRVNPYTGKRYLEDPGIAIIEINNENGLIQAWLMSMIDRYGTELKNILKKKWNGFLRKKYPSTSQLEKKWLKQTQYGTNFLKNSNFKNEQNWIFEQHDKAKGTVAFSGNQAIIDVINKGDSGWHIQFNQPNLNLEKDIVYTLSFKAKADKNAEISVNAGQAHPPWRNLGFYKNFKVTTEWEEYKFVFLLTMSDDNGRICFSDMGRKINKYFFKDVELKTGGRLGLLEGEKLGDIDIFTRDKTGSRTEAALSDWIEFLMNQEEFYWQTMYDYIKKGLGAKAFVVGTALGTSTPNIMNIFDIIDSHSYWHHPSFPNILWDSNDWYVQNESMVRNRNGGTISELSFQRIYDKPFMVSEYNHPEPNLYGSEAMWFLSAYAGLQDWDIIIGFDYSGIRDDFRNIAVNTYFNMAVNPVRSISFIPTSFAFRNSLLKPSEDKIFVELSKQEEVEKIKTSGAWNIVNASAKGLNPGLPLRYQTGIIPENKPVNEKYQEVSGFNNINPSDHISSTGEIKWDTNNGNLIVDSHNIKAYIGFHRGNSDIVLSDFIIRPEKTILNWINISITDIEKDNDDKKRILLIATGSVKNKNSVFKEYYSKRVLPFPPPHNEKITLGNYWGSPPVKFEGINAEIFLPSNDFEVYSLDESGNRNKKLKIKKQKNKYSFKISETYKTLWYEIMQKEDNKN
ncbi:MAG: carbohydrate binding domain-containing protein [Elusimicrobia bacterium]|nr:carbohydrate binding domain-containing protein [Elusimicrobiota bacterium]